MLLIICLLLLLIPGVFRNLMGLIGWLILIGIAVSLFH
jgi:hypothetical protein